MVKISNISGLDKDFLTNLFSSESEMRVNLA